MSLFLNASFSALDLWKYSHYVNAVSCLAIFLVMTVDPPKFLQGSQAANYGQLTAIGFLSAAIQSYYCVSSFAEGSPALSEAAIFITASVVVYNLGFFALTWPLRIAKNSPPIIAPEKFFCSLAALLSVLMVPALLLK